VGRSNFTKFAVAFLIIFVLLWLLSEETS